ncbi:hypothetical protein TNCV_3048211 [Trichonephila clavipes]|nr:hypothetical protein TNCV_3048211 [Trichonephila clavipes]
MESLGHASFPPRAFGRQDNEEATSGIRPLQGKFSSLPKPASEKPSETEELFVQSKYPISDISLSGL